MSQQIDLDRRRLIGAAALTLAAAPFAMTGSAAAQSKARRAHLRSSRARTRRSAPLKQIDAGVLNVGYAEAGPADGPVVILLHGWPYDIYSFVDVAPLLAAAGYRVIVPYLRGYGTTRFLSGRHGRATASRRRVAVDIIALMDALKIEKAILAGFDWGARTADIIAALWPRALQGDGLGQRLSDRQPGGRQGAAAAEGRAAVVVSVLFRHRARPGRLREIPARLRQADLAARVAEMEFRRRHLRSQRGGVRQSGSCRHRDPQLSLAARPGRGRGEIRRAGEAARRGSRSSPCRPSPWKATPTARRIREPARLCQEVLRQIRAPADHAAASATICRRKRRRPSPKP